MWLALVAAVLLLCIVGAIYLSFVIARLSVIRRMSGGRNWLALIISFGIVAMVFLIITLAFSVVDAVTVFIHVVFFFVLAGAAIGIISAVKGAASQAPQGTTGNPASQASQEKTGNLASQAPQGTTGNPASQAPQGTASKQICNTAPKSNLQVYIAIALSVIYLSIGYYQCMNVWETTYKLSSDKVSDPVRIALIADSHIGATFDGEGFAKHIDEIMSKNPDVLMIAGDFVDDDSKKEDLIIACEALGRIDPKYGVWFVYGNHDKGYYQSRDFSAAELDEILRTNGINVLEDEVAYVGELCIVGRRDASTVRSRKGMSELLNDIDTSKYIVVLDHEPNDYENEARSDADLVLSGHTHGGQFIPLGLIQDIIKANDSVYGHEVIEGTHFIVTSGISNWALHFKTGTRSEYVIIDIE